MSSTFWDKVRILGEDDCWEWTGFINPRTGYGQVSLEGYTRRVHRVAYESRNGLISKPDQVVRHICHNKSCCNPKHLVLGTQSENYFDSYRVDRHSRGERHGMSKLTDGIVKKIFSSPGTERGIAKVFGVSQRCVHNIKHGIGWKHLQLKETR